MESEKNARDCGKENVLNSELASVQRRNQHPSENSPASLSLKKLSFPFLTQTKDHNCAPTIWQALLPYYGLHNISLGELEKLCNTTKKYGTFPEDMAAAAEKLGFKAEVKQGATGATIDALADKINNEVPAIVLYTIHCMTPLPESIKPPASLWYAWEDKMRHLSLSNRTMRKVLRPFETPHYLVVVGYDEKNMIFVDVSQGKERSIPKDEFEKMWFGEMDKKDQGTWYQRWMMTISKNK